MNDLAALQAFLSEVLRRPRSLASDDELSAKANEVATGSARLSPVEQLDVYREQFFLRHVDCLREDFGTLERFLGRARFEAVAIAYLGAVPPSSFTLRDLGTKLSSFLATTEPWRADPFVAELARVEWAFVEAFDGPDTPPFDPASIAGLPEEAWPRARIDVDPSLQRLDLAYPAHEVRIASRRDPKRTIERPAPRRSFVVIGRGPDALRAWDLEHDAFALLDALADGVVLGEACELAADASGVPLDAFQIKLAGWFAEWTARGFLRRVVG